ncbi:hypothetical protein SBRY_50157 [Actinacidiphila bryophytorum]|uniref:Uncharacterized protein n=1 Tax=Actinacidiphila bryophytorum TaxID=1436133 RepID=A0A9W4MJ28_9ACTN|nr:hypothetical protein SBRY_50157 [Actinacidiphila bryophytorum]
MCCPDPLGNPYRFRTTSGGQSAPSAFVVSGGGHKPDAGLRIDASEGPQLPGDRVVMTVSRLVARFV